MLSQPATLEAFTESPLFEIPEESIKLIGEDAKKLSGDQMSDMLDKFSRGDWGSVTEVVRRTNDEQQRSSGPQDGAFLGQYEEKVGEGDIVYYVYGDVINGRAKTLHIVSKENDHKLRWVDVMDEISKQEQKRN